MAAYSNTDPTNRVARRATEPAAPGQAAAHGRDSGSTVGGRLSKPVSYRRIGRGSRWPLAASALRGLLYAGIVVTRALWLVSGFVTWSHVLFVGDRDRGPWGFVHATLDRGEIHIVSMRLKGPIAFAHWVSVPDDPAANLHRFATEWRMPVLDLSGDWSDWSADIRVPLWLAALVLAMGVIGDWAWRRRRNPPGYCHKCGYNLTGNVSGVCPECGNVVEAER